MNWIPLALYTLITMFFLRDWLWNFSNTILGSEKGDGSLTIWIAYWPYVKLKSLLNGESLEAYLNSNIFYGFEGGYSFSDMMPALLPMVAILDSTFHSPIITINVIQLSFIILLPYGNYLLCREFGYDPYVSFVSGLVCSFTGFHIQQYLHLQLQFVFFIPIGMVYCIRYIKKPSSYELSIVGAILVFLAGSSIHIFIYFIFSIFLFIIISLFYSYKFKKYDDTRILIQKSITIKNIFILILTFLLILTLIYPYYHNMVLYHFKRLKVESIAYSYSPLDLKSFGFHPLLYILLGMSIFFVFRFHTLIDSERFKIKAIYLVCTLVYLLSLGAKKYYPYNLLFDYFPGFSGIRDSSRIIYLFWIPYGLVIGFILTNFHKYFRNQKLFYLLLSTIFITDLLLLNDRAPILDRFQIPEEMIAVHRDYSLGKYKEPLLLVSDRPFITSYVDIDATSQYLSIFHKKNLVGGYSGQYTHSLFMLRSAISKYLSGDLNWKKEEIESVISSSPSGSIALYDVPNEWKTKLSEINSIEKTNPKPCPKYLRGSWRNLPQISPNYGLILGYTPSLDFCINTYNVILDSKISLKWIKESTIEYEDTIYVSTPFYHHPSAPEILYNTEGFRKKGEYIVEIYQENQHLYTGKVLVK
jgi:hypothetical protein